jgi:sulfur carrier protein
MQLEAGQRISIFVNGEAVETGAATVAQLLAEIGFGEAAVATAVNGDFVARAQRATTRLGVGDKIEIVAPRQGG